MNIKDLWPFAFFILAAIAYQLKLFFHFKYLQKKKKEHLEYKNFLVFELKGKSIGGPNNLNENLMFYLPTILLLRKAEQSEIKRIIILANIFSVLSIILVIAFYLAWTY